MHTCMHRLLALHLSASHAGAALTLNPGFRSCPFVCLLCLWIPTLVVWDWSAVVLLQYLNEMRSCVSAALWAACFQNPWCQPPAFLVVPPRPTAKSADIDPLSFQDICLLPTVGPLGCWQLAILAWTFAHYLLSPSFKALWLFPCFLFFPVPKIIHSFKGSFIDICIYAVKLAFTEC